MHIPEIEYYQNVKLMWVVVGGCKGQTPGTALALAGALQELVNIYHFFY